MCACIKVARRNHWLRFSTENGGYLHQLCVPFLLLPWRNRRHEVNGEKRDASGQLDTKLWSTGKAPLVDDLALGNR